MSNAGTMAPPPGFIVDSVIDTNTQWDGPKHVTDKWQVTTQWNPSEGIVYFIEHEARCPWTPAEVEALPAALDSVKRETGQGAALEHLRRNPELVTSRSTMDQIYRNALEIGLMPSDLVGAWIIIRDGHNGSSK